MQVFLDLEYIFSFLTTQGLYKSTIQKSASLPTVKFPFSILRIFAGLLVNNLIILNNFTDSLWKSSNANGKRVRKLPIKSKDLKV